MKKYLENILYYSFCLILVSLIILFFSHSIISFFFKFQIPLIEKFDIYSLLSGIIGSIAFKNFFIPALNDYMGFFEIAYKMIKKGQLSKKNFYMSYYYRLEVLIDVKYITDKLNSEEQYWVNFNKLIKMINKFKKEECL